MAVVHLNQNNFNDVVLKSSKPVLIDFWASWCGPCRMQSPIIDEISDEMESQAVVAKVDVDAEPELAQKFSVMSIPTLVVLKDGKVVKNKVGLTNKSTLKSFLMECEK